MSKEFHDYIGTIIPPKWILEYLGGQMTRVIGFIEKLGVKRENFLASGSTCIVWKFDTSVLKLCTKRIEYFKSFPSVTVPNFKKLINEQFCAMLLPIREVLYEDNNFFVYTQEQIKILNLPDVDVNAFCQILDTVKTMFEQNALTSDLISSNFGWTNDHHLYLLDYHDMKPVDEFFKKKCWSKIVRCLMEHASYMLYHKGFEAHSGESIINWKSEMYIVKKNFGSDYFPEHLTRLFKSFSSNNRESIYSAINNCQNVLHGGIPQKNDNSDLINIPQASKHLHLSSKEKKKIKKDKKKLKRERKHERKHEHKHEHKHH